MDALRKGLIRGLVAGAAGTSALNAITYLDMAARRRRRFGDVLGRDGLVEVDAP